MTHPIFVAVFLIGVATSAAWAKDLCIEVTAGPDAGSHLVLKNVKAGRGKLSPVHGYFARFDAAADQIARFFAVDGQTLTSSVGNLAGGATWHNAGLDVDPRFLHVGEGLFAINFVCQPGSDGQIGPADDCFMRIENGVVGSDNGTVIPCADAAKLP
jgi:hypothetical protein